LNVLVYLSRAPAPTVGVTQVAAELDISKAAAHRILTTLKESGLVEVDEVSRRYRLGPGVLALASRYLGSLDVLEAARPLMRSLSQETAETVTMSIRTGWERVYVDQVTPLREVKMSVQIGKPFPLHAGSSGKVTLAFMPADDVETYLKHDLRAVTESTVTDVVELRRQLDHIRGQGYAQSFGERQIGAGSTAAPILDAGGHAVAVMSVCGPVERFRDEVDDCSRRLLAVTGQLSARMGHRDITKPTS
jgi:DNA-binding IclR family transcriptional regulator